MRCPNCERLGNPLDKRQFQHLERPARYETELNPIYKCVKRTGGCGHTFSPTDIQVMQVWRMWLSGELVPAASRVNKGDNGS